MGTRTITAGLAALATSIAATFVLVPLSNAADGTGAYGEFAVNSPPTTGFITFTGTVFPSATFTSTDASLSVARSATLTGRTPFGAYFGSSSGKTYLSSAIASGKPRGTLTIEFDSPPVPGTWAFALGDVDAEDVVISGTTPTGATVNANDWVHDGFNYTASGTDIPTWDPTTSTVIGNGSDTEGAAIWMSPTQQVSSITLTQVRRAGFPQYQLWIAADIVTAADVPDPDPTETTVPLAPDGKVTICHATSSTRNPYNEITVSVESVTRRNGHGSHTGGIYPSPGWGDIIPPFADFPGLNWPAGASILNNNCEVGSEALVFSDPSPTSSPTGSPSAGPSPSASASPTTSPSATPSTTPSPTVSASPTSSPTTSESPTASASGSPTASATPSPTASTSPSPSPTTSVSPTATPDSTASPTASPTTSPSPTSSPVASPSPTRTAEPTEVPAETRTVIEPTDIPALPPGSTITDVEPPRNGTAEVRDGEIVYTPDPGFRGEERIIVIVTSPDGTTQEVSVNVLVGKEQALITRWTPPKKLVAGTTRFGPGTFMTNAGQQAKVSAKCSILQRRISDNPPPTCSVTVGKEGTFLNVTVFEPTGVEVAISAPKRGKYAPLKDTYFYRVSPQ